MFRSLNRTIVELKFRRRRRGVVRFPGLNRTIVELKLYTPILFYYKLMVLIALL